MLDDKTVTGKVVAAAMKCAADRPWSAVSLREIADVAGVSLAELREGGVAGKIDILIELVGAADRHVLKIAPAPDLRQSPRDRLFEVIMCRLDALEPYKPGLKSVAKSAPADFLLCRHALASQAWMLEAGGISSEGLAGGLKAAGLATVYAQVLRVWLDDDDPGLARTMAALDRRLRRGERAVAGLDEAAKGCRRFCETLVGVLTQRRPERGDAATSGADAGPTDAPRSGDDPPAVQFPDPSPGPT
jgi:ubiquinone biosynthesis protein COQ9